MRRCTCFFVTAAGFSEKMVAQADATALTYPNASFDAVVIANTLHIMPDPSQTLGFVTYFPWSDESYQALLQSQGFAIVHSEMMLWSDFPERFVVCRKENEAQRQ